MKICLTFLFLMYLNMGFAQPMSEPHRPQFHFTPPAKWMNDPNGMVYFKGEYHLFYQHYPDSSVWGPMHWGHAVSKDLVHWQQLPIALYPDSLGCIFSGSVVVDEKNTSGFGKKGSESPLVAIFTYHNFDGEKAKTNDFQSQGIAYSLDKGRTWTKYAQNPVLKSPNIRDFRDPKVFWHAASQRWVMTLAVADRIRFYVSKNLKDWTLGSEFGAVEGSHGGVWECPDLFPMKVVGADKTKWVLIVNIGNGAANGGSGTQYFVGDFDGKTFKNDNPTDKTLFFDYGKDNYAGVTWSNNPDGRRLFLGWMSNWQYATKVPTEAWRSAMTVPRELGLHPTAAGLRLFQKPVRELKVLRGAVSSILEMTIKDSKIIDNQSVTKEIALTFDLSKTASTATTLGVVLSNSKNEHVEIGYDAAAKQFFTDRTEGGKSAFSKDFTGRHVAPRLSDNSILKMHILIDVSSVELFADDGSVAITTIFFPTEDFKTTQIFSKNGIAKLLKGQVWTLRSIWH